MRRQSLEQAASLAGSDVDVKELKNWLDIIIATVVLRILIRMSDETGINRVELVPAGRAIQLKLERGADAFRYATKSHGRSGSVSELSRFERMRIGWWPNAISAASLSCV